MRVLVVVIGRVKLAGPVLRLAANPDDDSIDEPGPLAELIPEDAAPDEAGLTSDALGEELDDPVAGEAELDGCSWEEVEFSEGAFEGKPKDGRPELGTPDVDELKEAKLEDTGPGTEELGDSMGSPVNGTRMDELGERASADVEFEGLLEAGEPEEGRPEESKPEESKPVEGRPEDEMLDGDDLVCFEDDEADLVDVEDGG